MQGSYTHTGTVLAFTQMYVSNEHEVQVHVYMHSGGPDSIPDIVDIRICGRIMVHDLQVVGLGGVVG